MVQDYCREKLGKLDSRIQLRSFKEVKAHNAAGQCWLTLDGEHPATLLYLTIGLRLFFRVTQFLSDIIVAAPVRGAWLSPASRLLVEAWMMARCSCRHGFGCHEVAAGTSWREHHYPSAGKPCTLLVTRWKMLCSIPNCTLPKERSILLFTLSAAPLVHLKHVHSSIASFARFAHALAQVMCPKYLPCEPASH